MNYSHLRLNDESELIQFKNKMGEDKYKKYLEKLYNFIDSMKPGTSFRVDSMVIEENRELFIKLLCLFIWMHGTIDYYFNETFTRFYKNKTYGQKRKKL